MSDIERKVQSGNAAEVIDLSELSAVKNPDLSPGELTPANNQDLTDLSISDPSVTRVPHTPIARGVRSRSNGADVGTVTLSNSRSRTGASKSPESGKIGVFKNPFYRYDGGLMNKLIAFIGNILKLIERFILRLFGMRDAGPLPAQQKNQSKPNLENNDQAQDAADKQKKDKESRKDRLEANSRGAMS